MYQGFDLAVCYHLVLLLTMQSCDVCTADLDIEMTGQLCKSRLQFTLLHCTKREHQFLLFNCSFFFLLLLF